MNYESTVKYHHYHYHPVCKMWQFRQDLVGAGVRCPPKSLGQFLKIWGRVIHFGADIATKYIYTIWHCPCSGCPKRGKLPRMGQLAAHLAAPTISSMLMPRSAHWIIIMSLKVVLHQIQHYESYFSFKYKI